MKSRLAVSFTAAVAFALSSTVLAASSHLSKHDHSLLAQAQVSGKSSVSLLIAAKPGAANAVATAVRSLGATMRYREDSLDYLRVVVAADKVATIAALPGVEAVSVDEKIPLILPVPAPNADAVQVAPPDASTPPQNAYMPTRDVGSPQFVAAHPTYDGRGVVVGILDSGVTLTIRASRRRARAHARSATGSRSPIRSPTTTPRGST